ncbi:MAG TPA: SPOR domain-containing protein [Methylomirabilota bacterium]|jgi:cell division protein FtsN|nr:SPOR domain-containing protein [Methylomirabilota bacterium]
MVPSGRRPLQAQHELRFGTRELTIFAVAFVLIWALTFVFGVLVGRELASGGRPAPTAGGSRAQLAEAAKKTERAGMEERLTFYKTLTAPTVELPPTRPPTVEERLVPAEPAPVPLPAKPERRPGGGGTGEGASGRPTGTRGEAVAAPVAKATGGTAGAAEPGWTVQVSSFRSRALAEELRSRLAAKGFDAYLITVTTETGRVRHRVRVGAFPSRAEAERVAEELRGERNLNPFVVARR